MTDSVTDLITNLLPCPREHDGDAFVAILQFPSDDRAVVVPATFFNIIDNFNILFLIFTVYIFSIHVKWSARDRGRIDDKLETVYKYQEQSNQSPLGAESTSD